MDVSLEVSNQIINGYSVAEYFNPSMGMIYHVSNMLLAYQILYFTKYIENGSNKRIQTIEHDVNINSFPDWVFHLESELQDIHGYEDYVFLPVITKTLHNPGQHVGWHFDEAHTENEKYKVVFYLTDSAGTEFRIDKGATIKVKPRKGDVVIFDLNYEHRGIPFKKGKKLLYGLRLGLPEA